MAYDVKSLSKFLSYVLRHRPDSIGLELDSAGWTDVDVLLNRARAKGKRLTREILEEVVRTNDKQRFAFSPDGTRIRASQGHSIHVELGLEPLTPPDLLYHGTASRFLEPIRREGLKPMSRTHVHLSADHATAVNVGARHGKPIVLLISSGEMHSAGISFYRSQNGVWLVETVPTQYIVFPEAV